MALGSLLTLAVLVAAVMEGPKLMRGGAVGAQGIPASAGATANASSAVAAPAALNAGASAPTPASGAAPVQLPRPIQQPVPAQYAFRPARPPVQAARASETAPIAQAALALQAAPAPAATALAVQAAPAPAATAFRPITAATASPELKELRDRINRVAIRAVAAQAGVRSIEQGVQWQGLGLRGDIKAASIRLDYVLQEARASLQSGDVEGARNNLQYAEGTLQKLDKFLGQ